MWQCFRKNKCGVTGNIFTLLRYLRVNPDDVPIHAVDYIDFKIRDVFDYGSRVHELKYLPAFSKRIYKHPYIDSRVELDYDRVEVIDAKSYEDYVIFPIRMDGTLVGWCGRNVSGKETKRKYYNCRGMLNTLFGYDELTSTAILVEGIFDRLKILPYLPKGVSCVSTLGCHVTPTQITHLVRAGVCKVYFWHERDVKSFNGTFKRLCNYFTCFVGDFIDDDPGELSREEFGKRFSKSMSAEDYSLRVCV